MGATGQLSGIWHGLWASAFGGAAQSDFMFIKPPHTAHQGLLPAFCLAEPSPSSPLVVPWLASSPQAPSYELASIPRPGPHRADRATRYADLSRRYLALGANVRERLLRWARPVLGFLEAKFLFFFLVGARSRCFCCLDPIPPLRGGARKFLESTSCTALVTCPHSFKWW